ncbi:hypothetical protein Hypma_007003 [Hypsizygus marmoreus]|uniref:Uncharacterized protein n=1 Tax=Hypsizygus marmoreus TaxID=39966 RepID=A0A369KFE4_HYPMA|nr:hypothetical protein Hypma_007003 [Hypsizygus marmoreus]
MKVNDVFFDPLLRSHTNLNNLPPCFVQLSALSSTCLPLRTQVQKSERYCDENTLNTDFCPDSPYPLRVTHHTYQHSAPTISGTANALALTILVVVTETTLDGARSRLKHNLGKEECNVSLLLFNSRSLTVLFFSTGCKNSSALGMASLRTTRALLSVEVDTLLRWA